VSFLDVLLPSITFRTNEFCWSEPWIRVAVTSSPELTEDNARFTLIQWHLYGASWALVGVEFEACDF